MERFDVEAKKGQSKEKFEAILAEVWKKNSGSVYESLCRHLMSACGLRTAMTRAKGHVDMTVRINGKTLRVEIKTGEGIVAMTGAKFNDSIENYTEADIYPDADVVLYAPGADKFSSLDELLYESLWFEGPAAFAEFIIDNSVKRKHGFSTAFKLAVDNATLRAENEKTPPRPVLNKKGEQEYNDDGTPKVTKRGLPRWTDCIAIQTTYKEQLIDAVRRNEKDIMTFGEWLRQTGRYIDE